MKNFLKIFLKRISPVPLSKNQRYDRLTKQILQRHLSTDSNCVDAGCFRGEILDLFLKFAPAGNHFVFEPIPILFKGLEKKYSALPHCRLFNYALGNENGETRFNYVVSNPAYSGIRNRKYGAKNEKVEMIMVPIRKLDDVIKPEVKIEFMKVDVEGGEFDLLKGAEKMILRDKPLIVFEFGVGAADLYGTTPGDLFQWMDQREYKISLLDKFLNKKSPLSLQGFSDQFNQKMNYYFIAHPVRPKKTLM